MLSPIPCVILPALGAVAQLSRLRCGVEALPAESANKQQQAARLCCSALSTSAVPNTVSRDVPTSHLLAPRAKVSSCAVQVEQLQQASRDSRRAAEEARQEAAQHLHRAEGLQQAVEDLSAQEAKSQDELRAQASSAAGRAR